MKKTLLFACCVVAMISCSNNTKTKKQQETGDSVAAIPNETTQMVQDSLDYVNFTTPDLMLFNVKGHVKEVDYDEVAPCVITFDENGLVSSCPCHDEDLDFTFKDGKAIGKNFSSKRNAKNQLTRYAYEPNIRENYWYLDVYEMTYNDKGQVKTIEHGGWETDSKQTFTYNAEGLCTQIVHDYGIEATSGVRTITYTYTKFDSHGNWTERNAKTHEEETNEWKDDGTPIKKVNDWESVEKRSITYYPYKKSKD
ncbi:MAG: hypothetical protein MR681_02860 [Prevotella sp.]|nr:hypothetical protein [Prevotella sp.]